MKVKGVKGLVPAKFDGAGRLVIKLPKFAKPGKRKLLVRYGGDEVNAAKTFGFTIRVVR